MKNNLDDKLERLSEKIMSDTSLEKPSEFFNENIMYHIEKLSSVTIYKPLIPRSVWMLIASFFGMVILLSYGGQIEGLNWFNQLPIEIGLKNSLPMLNLPKAYVYGFLCLAILVIIQVPILKYYFDKRFEV